MILWYARHETSLCISFRWARFGSVQVMLVRGGRARSLENYTKQRVVGDANSPRSTSSWTCTREYSNYASVGVGWLH